jgi:hypothetical protein
MAAEEELKSLFQVSKSYSEKLHIENKNYSHSINLPLTVGLLLKIGKNERT